MGKLLEHRPVMDVACLPQDALGIDIALRPDLGLSSSSPKTGVPEQMEPMQERGQLSMSAWLSVSTFNMDVLQEAALGNSFLASSLSKFL